MEDYYYSPSNNTFYPKSLHPLYAKSKSLPEDLVKVTEAVFREFINPPEGMTRFFQDGSFIWKRSDVSERTSSLERLWRDSELSRADIELYKVQDNDPKAIGTVGQWREYRKALRAWPEHKDFPNKEKRPVAPDAVVEDVKE